jgi:hypothetical protein
MYLPNLFNIQFIIIIIIIFDFRFYFHVMI